MAKVELIIPVELAPKRRNTAKINIKTIIIDVTLLYLNLFQDSLFIISTKIKAVIETNILAKVANTATLDSVEVILGISLK
jgi:hypothetical protein